MKIKLAIHAAQLAAPEKGKDLSGGFSTFFDTLGLTGTGLVVKGIVAVLAIISLKMMLEVPKEPKKALRNGTLAVGTLFVAVVLAMYGETLFSTVTDNQAGG